MVHYDMFIIHLEGIPERLKNECRIEAGMN